MPTDRPRYVLRKATCHSLGQDLHLLEDCPRNHTCPVWSLTPPTLRSRLYPSKKENSNGS